MNNRRLNIFVNKNSRFGNFPTSYKSLKLWRHQCRWTKFSRRRNCANFQDALKIHSSGIWHPPLILPLPTKETQTRWYFWKRRCRKSEFPNWLSEFLIYFGNNSYEKSPASGPFGPLKWQKTSKTGNQLDNHSPAIPRKVKPPLFPFSKNYQDHCNSWSPRVAGSQEYWISESLNKLVFLLASVSADQCFRHREFSTR